MRYCHLLRRAVLLTKECLSTLCCVALTFRIFVTESSDSRPACRPRSGVGGLGILDLSPLISAYTSPFMSCLSPSTTSSKQGGRTHCARGSIRRVEFKRSMERRLLFRPRGISDYLGSTYHNDLKVILNSSSAEVGSNQPKDFRTTGKQE